MRIAVCPGSFDPITVGHLDLAERAAAIFDRVILCVMVNGEKKHMFTLDERLELARAAAAHLPNVEAAACGGLLADFAAAHGASVIVRGVRNVTDFDAEYQMALINKGIHSRLETMLLPAGREYQHFSSSMVREMIRYRQPLEKYLPMSIVPMVLEMMGSQKG